MSGDDGGEEDVEEAGDDGTEQPGEESPMDEFGLRGGDLTDRAGDPTAEPDDPEGDGSASGAASDDPPGSGGADADAPLSSLAASVDERRDRAVDPAEDELFDEEDVPEIDTEVVWDRLDEDEPPELPEETQQDVRVVEKRSYCEQCPFFSAPPDVRCTHDGTEILELVDMERFRVVDCPKVREDERLERL
ncbi:hypothetical protein L593_14255 [Salinarchaeum sp. Harcht-Bsk1]|uniref:hypothetical protein n=1 Tax=Salinarchaeum sp. Harcht-Bsk1 TaxID=1333523 RepID=UPI0003422844|nr:hypothetical protein [Salinarchaeum sp. Harcht-Bsk1]AGN02790.1 hypothetical protein L593_14255 [Salinarchaeum sp. Harcht-Bsk1]